MDWAAVFVGAVAGIVVGVFIKVIGEGIIKKTSNGDSKKYLNCPINQDAFKEAVREMKSEIDWLKEAHSKTDVDGIPMWYAPRWLFHELKASISATNENLSKIVKLIEAIQRESLHGSRSNSKTSGA